MRLASTLCYVQAVFLFLSAIALGIPAFAGGGAPLTAFAFVTGIAAVGIGFSSGDPLPSPVCPTALSPQHRTDPSLMSAHE